MDCRCGCGNPVFGVYLTTERRAGRVAGEPRRFLPGHAVRPRPNDRVPQGCPLSNREYEVLQGVAKGLSYKQIAGELHMSAQTARSHASNSFSALELSNRKAPAAIIAMQRRGWLDAPPRLRLAPDPQLPATHLAYTWAFTRLVLERTVLCENMVTLAFMLLCLETGVRPEGKRNVPDIDALLMRIGRGASRPVYAGLDELAEAA